MIKLSKLRKKAAFTLTELGIAAGSMAVVGGTIYVLLTAGLNLFARNHAINRSSELARTTLDYLTRDLHASIETPTLIDASGSPVAVTGPSTISAAGVKFRKFIAGPLKLPNATAASATTITLNIQSSDSRPMAGQILVIPASTLNVLPQDVYAKITAVGGGPLTPTVTLAAAIGSYMTPTASSGTVAPANSVAYIVQEVSYVVTTPRLPAPQVPELRFYKRAMSVATDGTSAFHNVANYTIVTPNMSVTRTPFRRSATDKALSVQLTAEDDRYSKRLSGSFIKSLSIGTTANPHTIPCKSLGL